MDSLKIAINTENAVFSPLGNLFDTIFRAKESYTEPGVKVIRLTPQTLLELHGPGAYSKQFLFSKSDIVIHLEVDNLVETLETAVSLGFTVIKELRGLSSFAYIRIGDAFILGFYEKTNKP